MIVVGTLTNIEQDNAVPQVSEAKQMFARLFENMKTRQAPLQVPKAPAFFLLGLNLGRRVDPPVTGRIRGRPSPKCCSANSRQRLGVHTAVPNWTGRPPLESAGLHLARWMHRGILIGVDRMRGSLCDRRGMSRFPCDEDCRSRIGADLDDSIGQELMRGRMSASSAAEDRLRERAVAA